MKKVFRYTVVWLPPLIIAAAFILRKYIWAAASVISQNVSMCRFYAYTGILCPGCGGTRSFIAFMGGDMLTSLKCNPSVITGVILLVMLYAEMSAAAFGRKIRIIPRGKIFWIISGVIFAAWCVLRNFIVFLQP